ncbi:CLUMA_CG017851, isoform A [Clunio marinus]|uniref:CLUMA_CG017851, isoform A n=1 Tax=Clunio marinus TaxID=568069 RepID=A0A1J1IWY7_9DIPT|nr:CLUMA_CG017851, isoform A [Clunio marinus]
MRSEIFLAFTSRDICSKSSRKSEVFKNHEMNSILITGCNRGLGLGLVKSLIKHEQTPKFIFATCRSLEKADELREISKNNSNVHVLEIDLKDFDKYQSLVEQIEGIVKDEGLNVLFNSAGISPKSSFLGLKALKANELMEVYQVNVVAPLMLTKALLPLMRKASTAKKEAPLGVQRAAIVNMSSILGSIQSNNDGSLYHYRVTKSGLNAATKSLSVDLRNDGIIAVNMHPGWVKTDMGGPKAPMDVEQSCDAMVKTVFNLNKSHNGGFIQYDGRSLPW